MNGMVIRDIGPDDRTAVTRFIVDFQDDMRAQDPNLLPGSHMADEYFAYLSSHSTASPGRFLVAQEGENLLGYCCFWVETPEDAFCYHRGSVVLVSDLFVVSSHRRKGIGNAFLRAAEEHAVVHGHGVLRLRVLSKNLPALGFYARQGFRENERSLEKELDFV